MMSKKVFLVLWGLSIGPILYLALSPSFHVPLYVDKVLHMTLAFVLMLGPIAMTRNKTIIYGSGFVLMILSVLAEFIQAPMPERSAELYDVLANGVGVFLSFAFFYYLRYIRP